MMRPTRQALTAVTSVLLLGATVTASTQASSDPPSRSLYRAVATANPDPAHPTIDAVDTREDRAQSRTISVRTVAQASADCTGCRGAALAVHVLTFRSARVVTADNVAAAWSSCEGCTVTAVSLQVVVGTRAGTLVPANRALALTATCTGCRAQAFAYQILVSGSDPRRATAALAAARQALSRLRQTVDLPLASRQAVPGAGQGEAADVSVQALAAALRRDLPDATVTVHRDTRVSGSAP